MPKTARDWWFIAYGIFVGVFLVVPWFQTAFLYWSVWSYRPQSEPVELHMPAKAPK